MPKVTVTSKGGYAFSAKTAAGGGFEIDAKTGPVGPLDAFLASLAACVGVYIRKYAEGAKITLEGYSVTAEAELSKDKPVRFGLIDVAVDLGAAALDERRKTALLDFIRNCPVHNTLKGDPEILVRIA